MELFLLIETSKVWSLLFSFLWSHEPNQNLQTNMAYNIPGLLWPASPNLPKIILHSTPKDWLTSKQKRHERSVWLRNASPIMVVKEQKQKRDPRSGNNLFRSCPLITQSPSINPIPEHVKLLGNIKI